MRVWALEAGVLKIGSVTRNYTCYALKTRKSKIKSGNGDKTGHRGVRWLAVLSNGPSNRKLAGRD